MSFVITLAMSVKIVVPVSNDVRDTVNCNIYDSVLDNTVAVRVVFSVKVMREYLMMGDFVFDNNHDNVPDNDDDDI